MANKLFVSARIPEELHKKLESYADEIGESKSSVLIDALNKYFSSEDSISEKESNLENQVRYFEQWVFERIKDIDNRVKALEELKDLEKLKDLLAVIQELQEGNGSKVLQQEKEIRCLTPARDDDSGTSKK